MRQSERVDHFCLVPSLSFGLMAEHSHTLSRLPFCGDFLDRKIIPAHRQRPLWHARKAVGEGVSSLVLLIRGATEEDINFYPLVNRKLA